MKNQFKKVLKLSIICLFLTYISCEKDLYENSIKNDNIGKAHVLSKTEAEKVASRVKGILGAQGLLNNNSSAKTITLDFGSINYDQILKIIDEYGKENYTFQISYPEESDTKFANLVLQEKDTYTTIKVVEYNMTDEFARQYKLDADMSQFKGIIKILPVFSDAPCPEPPLIIQIGDVPHNTTGGGGGGGNNPGNNPGDTTGPGTGGGGSGYSDAFATISVDIGDADQDDEDETGEWDSNTDWHSKISIEPIVPTDPTAPADPCPKETQIGILAPIDFCVKDFMTSLDSDQKAWLYQQQQENTADFYSVTDFVDGNGAGACSLEKNNLAKDYINNKSKRICESTFSFSDVGSNWQNAGVSSVNITFITLANGTLIFANISFTELHFGFPKAGTGGLYITNNNAKYMAQIIMTQAEVLTDAFKSANPNATPTETRTFFYTKLQQGMAEFGGTISTSPPLGWTGTLREFQNSTFGHCDD